MHFRHISVKIQPKNLKLVYYQFLAMRGNIRLGAAPRVYLGLSLVTPIGMFPFSQTPGHYYIAPFCRNPYQIQSQ